MRYRGRTLAVGVLVVGLAAAGCSKTTNDSSGGKDTKAEKQVINVDAEGKAPVPAPEVPGAKKGGTITWLQEGAPEHLDPGQIYVSDALDVSTHLLFRTLTYLLQVPLGGFTYVIWRTNKRWRRPQPVAEEEALFPVPEATR